MSSRQTEKRNDRRREKSLKRSRRQSDRRRQRRLRHRKYGIRVPGWITLIVQLAASAALLIGIIAFDTIPARQTAGIACVLALVLLAALAGQVLGYRRRVLRWGICILSLLITAVCALALTCVRDSQDFVEEITTDNGEKYSASVIVSAQSTYQKIEDLPGVRYSAAASGIVTVTTVPPPSRGIMDMLPLPDRPAKRVLPRGEK